MAMGLVLHDPKNLAGKARVIIEPPVTLGKTVILTSTRIGAYTYFRGGTISSLAGIGRFCSVAPGIEVGPGNHPTNFLSTHPFQYGASAFGFWPEFKNFDSFGLTVPADVAKKPPVIGNDVWIGARVFIARGVNIGDGAIIAAGSTVTKDVLPYEIVGGAPARHIRFRFGEDIINELLELKWWDYEPVSLSGVPFNDVRAAIDEISGRKAAGKLIPIAGRPFLVQGGKAGYAA